MTLNVDKEEEKNKQVNWDDLQNCEEKVPWQSQDARLELLCASVLNHPEKIIIGSFFSFLTLTIVVVSHHLFHRGHHCLCLIVFTLVRSNTDARNLSARNSTVDV